MARNAVDPPINQRFPAPRAPSDAEIDNQKYEARFGAKARMLPCEEAELLTGHPVGGVCPFVVNAGVDVYLDENSRGFGTVFPA